MKEAVVIVSAVRTPIGRYGGSFKKLSSADLASIAIKEAISRAGLSPEQVDEAIMGEVRQTTQSSNVARVAALRAGIPESSPAFTINRLCASGLQAVASGVQQIAFEQAEVIVAGGTESMSQSPIYLRNSRFGGGQPVLIDSNKEAGQQPKEIYGDDLGMGITAENVAEHYSISREDQDAFALESQRRALRAMEAAVFKDEIVPIEVRERKESFIVDRDEHPRPQTTLDKLASLRPAFKESGTVTAGNACGRNDGAAALMLMKESKAKSFGLTPMVRITDWAVSGVSPEVMGIGPIPAVKKLLEKTSTTIKDVGLVELNEAFASQSLAVIRELGLEHDRVNIHGGAIALGHPVGASGARILTTLLHALKRSDSQRGIATLCAGGGQGMALMVEKI
ncbi:acetyl-CoA C-acetyltransferase [Halobacillus alkaliphilus]|uniref:acetyl-CoA C-acetyltransferase n=1 Tax=Halobacillus alkaliphilus TaxID=396056 RepID=A0A1I2LJ25_9BACI|nr:thiolase family protein [Halobacillus alkaliphilus]SFF78568.1 acetyl-CoA C-acetyltransferase [Halobacillus alkaliphilus]